MTQDNEPPKDEPTAKDRSWLLHLFISIGAGLVLGIYRLWTTAAITSNVANRTGVDYVFALALAIAGIWVCVLRAAVLDIKRYRSPRQFTWIEWGALIVVVLVFANIPLSLVGSPPSHEVGAYVEVPIPVDNLVGGTQGLIADWPVEIVALVPNSSKTPEPTIFSDVEIRAFLGGAHSL